MGSVEVGSGISPVQGSARKPSSTDTGPPRSNSLTPKMITDREISAEIARMSLELVDVSGTPEILSSGVEPHPLPSSVVPSAGVGCCADSRARVLLYRSEILGCLDALGAVIPSVTRSIIADRLEAIVALLGNQTVPEDGSCDPAASCGGGGAGDRGMLVAGGSGVPGESPVSGVGGILGGGGGEDDPDGHYVLVRGRRGKQSLSSEPAAVRSIGGLVFIEPKENSNYKDLEELKRDVLKALDPLKKGYQLRKVIKSRSGGILIETGRGEDRRRILGDSDLRDLKIKITERRPLKPRVVIRRAPRTVEGLELDHSTLTECLRRQNFGGQVVLDTELRIVYKKGPKKRSVCDLVLEVNPRLRAMLIKGGRVFVGSHCCRVQDELDVTRCYKCQRFNHISNNCQQKEHTCGHCGEYGHCYLDCKSTDAQPSCPNCSRAGIKDRAHSVTSKSCPSYLAAIGRVRGMTDYGF